MPTDLRDFIVQLTTNALRYPGNLKECFRAVFGMRIGNPTSRRINIIMDGSMQTNYSDEGSSVHIINKLTQRTLC